MQNLCSFSTRQWDPHTSWVGTVSRWTPTGTHALSRRQGSEGPECVEMAHEEEQEHWGRERREEKERQKLAKFLIRLFPETSQTLKQFMKRAGDMTGGFIMGAKHAEAELCIEV